MPLTHVVKSNVTANADTKDFDLFVVSGTSAITIYLPDPATNPVGSRRCVKKTGASGTVTVQSLGSGQIDGAASFSLAAQYKFVEVVSDGANLAVNREPDCFLKFNPPAMWISAI